MKRGMTGDYEKIFLLPKRMVCGKLSQSTADVLGYFGIPGTFSL
jgi:hypothetical protein